MGRKSRKRTSTPRNARPAGSPPPAPRRRRGPVLASAALVVIVGALAAVGFLRGGKSAVDLGAAASHNVVLITLDTTRADHLGCYGDAKARTPRLDALAASG